LGILLSDDFGGTAIDTTKWTILQGGYTGIGSGTNTGITTAVAAGQVNLNLFYT
jgi:hypothetical protein